MKYVIALQVQKSVEIGEFDDEDKEGAAADEHATALIKEMEAAGWSVSLDGLEPEDLEDDGHDADEEEDLDDEDDEEDDELDDEDDEDEPA